MFKMSSSPLLALALLRILLGVLFFIHGSQKVLGLFGGPGLAEFAVWLSGYGFPPAIGYLVSFAQFIGSILMITGYYTRLGAFLNGLIMLGAMLFLTLDYGFFWHTNGFEFALCLALSCLVIIIGGPGKLASTQIN